MVFGINFNRLNAFEASESSCYRIYLKKLNKIQKTHVKPEIKNIQTEGEIKSQTQHDKDKNGKSTNQRSETAKI